MRPGKAGKPAWQRIVRSRVVRTMILGIGVVAAVTYVYLVAVMHPAAMTRPEHLQRRDATADSGSARSGPPPASRSHAAPRFPPPPPPPPQALASKPVAAARQQQQQLASDGELAEAAGQVRGEDAPPPPEAPEPPKPLRSHPYSSAKYRIWKLPAQDRSPRCQQSHICDGQYECGPDKLGCVTDDLQRKLAVREAGRWTWKGYRSDRAAPP